MIYYTVTRDDLMKASTFKWQKVLQPSCSTQEWRTIKADFDKVIKPLKTAVLYKQITMEEANIEIRKEVLKLTEKYPSAFPKSNELGSYSKQVLADKFLSGELTINSSYDVNVMLSERIALLREISETEARKKQEELLRLEAVQKAKEIAEANRVPIKVDMLFRTKDGIARAFIHQYPIGTKMSCIQRELPNALVLSHGKHCSGSKSWKVIEILIEGGMAYQEDILQWENKDAN